MKTKNLLGDISTWKFLGNTVNANTNKSKLHIAAGEILVDLFPTLQIIEEVPFHPYPGKTQYFDFYINQIKLAVEVNGQQHYGFNSMFHSCRGDFLNQRKRDNQKREWCELNGITLIELSYKDKVEVWKNQIINR